jgi:4-amino-4-deoxychorismate lyase
MIYSEEIQEITFVPYVYKEIKTLKLIDIGNWDYSYKYADRSFLTKLLTENQEVDEVIMTKNGFITDCTIANLAFYDGKNWFTPSTPLLKGTKRQNLLDRQIITEKEIKVEDLKNYQGLCLINTFRELITDHIILLNHDV